eukprot:SAG31_NODE_4856_length_2904_cov_1.292692_1_plen_209_part_00
MSLNYVARLADGKTERDKGKDENLCRVGNTNCTPELAALRPGDIVEALDCSLPSAVEPALLGWLGRLRLLRFAPVVAEMASCLADLTVATEDDVCTLCNSMRPLEARRFRLAIQQLDAGDDKNETIGQLVTATQDEMKKQTSYRGGIENDKDSRSGMDVAGTKCKEQRPGLLSRLMFAAAKAEHAKNNAILADVDQAVEDALGKLLNF